MIFTNCKCSLRAKQEVSEVFLRKAGVSWPQVRGIDIRDYGSIQELFEYANNFINQHQRKQSALMQISDNTVVHWRSTPAVPPAWLVLCCRNWDCMSWLYARFRCFIEPSTSAWRSAAGSLGALGSTRSSCIEYMACASDSTKILYTNWITSRSSVQCQGTVS